LNVSIIIPAHNAAETISEALESVIAQTHKDWEAIVVDDGSSDETGVICASFAQQDSRIRVVTQLQKGKGAARNTGIGLASFDWILFLDADDWLKPTHLERLTEILISEPELDGVHCGWARVASDGTLVGEDLCTHSDDLFGILACRSAFVIHACIVRRSLIENVGGFDNSLHTCEDWDLWQRIARTGARFGAVQEVLALYRMRQDSASLDGFQMLTDGVRVLTQGCLPDLRVQNPHHAHETGISAEELPNRKFYLLCWCAGLVLGQGRDARYMLEALKNASNLQLNPASVAEMIFRATPLPTCQLPAKWVELWPSLGQIINKFLLALEEKSQTLGLACRAGKELERLILDHLDAPQTITIGTTHATVIEITETIPDIILPESIERLLCLAEIEGTSIGTIELPVCDGVVPGHLIADAIATDFAWQILGRFFERTVYRDLGVGCESDDLSVWRGALHIGSLNTEKNQPFWHQLHDQIGWTIFLQEIWGHSDWPQERFYDPDYIECKPGLLRGVDNSLIPIDVSEEIPDMEVSQEQLDIVMTVGGVAIGTVTIPVKQCVVRAQEIRAAFTTASGYELCRAAVREALLGNPLVKNKLSLRQRLLAAAHETKKPLADHWTGELPTNVFLAPGAAITLRRAVSPNRRGVVIGQRVSGMIGTSNSRRAVIPKAAAAELLDSVSLTGEPVIGVDNSVENLEHLVYAPDLIWCPHVDTKPQPRLKNWVRTVHPANLSQYDRNHFETLFAAQPDPWKYTTPYEQTKYEQTLSLLPEVKINRALELACAEGHFTIQLASRVESLIAADISEIALRRTAERCTGLDNISFQRLDLTRDPLTGRFDLIVCCEVLYYVGEKEDLRAVATKLADALEPGGYLLMAHANLVVDESDKTGFDWGLPFGAKVIGETLSSIPSLWLMKELWTPLYRIQLFRRENRYNLSIPPEITEVIKCEQPTELLPEVASHVLWNGGTPWRDDGKRSVVTERLPILVYHRVSPDGSAEMMRYRVTPEAFEEQLYYLRDTGHYSVRLEDWHAAMDAKKPLPGRAVIITFDDGYLDFLTYAWPLLKRYGFSASVFPVANEIGGVNSWDRGYGEEVPLLGWKEIRHLRREGVEFGSHSATHPALNTLSPEEIVREGARSKAILDRNFSDPVRAFAYPYGAEDRVVQHLIGACGYIYGLSCRPELSRFHDRLLEIPRIEVIGSDTLEQFVSKLKA